MELDTGSKRRMLSVVLLSIMPIFSSAQAQTPPSASFLSLVSGAGFNGFASYLVSQQLLAQFETQLSQGDITVFAPKDSWLTTSEAQTFIQYLTNNPADFQQVLLYHIVPSLNAKQLEAGSVFVTMASRQTVKITTGPYNGATRFFVEQAPITDLARISTDQGVLHGIDGLLVPPNVRKNSCLAIKIGCETNSTGTPSTLTPAPAPAAAPSPTLPPVVIFPPLINSTSPAPAPMPHNSSSPSHSPSPSNSTTIPLVPVSSPAPSPTPMPVMAPSPAPVPVYAPEPSFFVPSPAPEPSPAPAPAPEVEVPAPAPAPVPLAEVPAPMPAPLLPPVAAPEPSPILAPPPVLTLAPPESAGNAKDVLAVLQARNYTMCLQYLQSTGVASALPSISNYTVLCPSDVSFTAFLKANAASLQAENTRSLLLYHVLVGTYTSAAIISAAPTAASPLAVTTQFNSQPLNVFVLDRKIFLGDNSLTASQVIDPDLLVAPNQIAVHGIDNVLVPKNFTLKPNTLTAPPPTSPGSKLRWSSSSATLCILLCLTLRALV